MNKNKEYSKVTKNTNLNTLLLLLLFKVFQSSKNTSKESSSLQVTFSQTETYDLKKLKQKNVYQNRPIPSKE